MAAVDYPVAAALLDELFAEAEAAFQNDHPPPTDPAIVEAADALFTSQTQSYREVLLGCGLARLLDQSINIRHPYINQGPDAFNGRTLDERVVNPFLHDRLIPSSRGPYLATFRRNVRFTGETAAGLKDKKGYAALLEYIAALERANGTEGRDLVLYLLYRFVLLRDASTIPLSRISRLSLDQFRELIEKLLQVQSGGRIPMLLTIALLRTIKDCYGLAWDIQWQGINVADRASDAGGDITVRQAGTIVLAVEVTERTVDRARVVSTFNTKIVQAGIEDYLFVYSRALPHDDARRVAATYFSQGHEINFLQVRDWIINLLGTMGVKCRELFTKNMLSLLDTPDVPASVKMAWNASIKGVVHT